MDGAEVYGYSRNVWMEQKYMDGEVYGWSRSVWI